jgi:hypothetical protein
MQESRRPLTERASGTVLTLRASGTLLTLRASGTVLTLRASGTTGSAFTLGRHRSDRTPPQR